MIWGRYNEGLLLAETVQACSQDEHRRIVDNITVVKNVLRGLPDFHLFAVRPQGRQCKTQGRCVGDAGGQQPNSGSRSNRLKMLCGDDVEMRVGISERCLSALQRTRAG